MFRNFDEMLKEIKKCDKKTVAIAAAHTPTALEAAVSAKYENIANSVLVGDKEIIVNYFNENHPEMLESFKIVDTGNDIQKAAEVAVKLVKDGEADILLKGKCDTATLLRAALDKEKGLRTGEIISDVLAYETPEKIVLLSDGGINLYPELKDKISIVKNSVRVAKGLGYENPKVALLAAVEVVNPKMSATIDAALISKMNQRGQIKGCRIDGPLAFDNAISMEAVRMKGIKSEVAGDADILIVPNIESGNIFGKSLTYYCHYRVAHVVMGAKAPILIASRADNAETKMLSMALGVISVQ
jgi:phosphate butyryltransferase